MSCCRSTKTKTISKDIKISRSSFAGSAFFIDYFYNVSNPYTPGRGAPPTGYLPSFTPSGYQAQGTGVKAGMPITGMFYSIPSADPTTSNPAKCCVLLQPDLIYRGYSLCWTYESTEPTSPSDLPGIGKPPPKVTIKPISLGGRVKGSQDVIWFETRCPVSKAKCEFCSVSQSLLLSNANDIMLRLMKKALRHRGYKVDPNETPDEDILNKVFEDGVTQKCCDNVKLPGQNAKGTVLTNIDAPGDPKTGWDNSIEERGPGGRIGDGSGDIYFVDTFRSEDCDLCEYEYASVYFKLKIRPLNNASIKKLKVTVKSCKKEEKERTLFRDMTAEEETHVNQLSPS